MRKQLFLLIVLACGSVFLSCGDDSSGECGIWCEKAKECLGASAMAQMGGLGECISGCNRNQSATWAQCALACDPEAECDDWLDCYDTCDGPTLPEAEDNSDDTDGDED